MRWLALAPLRVYQKLISPMLPATCRYYPSCSNYAVQAIERHGVLKGTWLGIKRLARCHPWAAGGVDPVPDEFRWWTHGHTTVSKELS